MGGVRCKNNEVKIFCGVLIEGSISFLLWIILINIIKENEAVIKDIKKIKGMELLFHKINLDIIIISLIVLMVGGAEIFRDININHQNVILGIMIMRPLNISVFREWYLIYKSLTKRKRAEEDNPWAIIIIIAPDNPILFMVSRADNTKPMWATDE